MQSGPRCTGERSLGTDTGENQLSRNRGRARFAARDPPARATGDVTVALPRAKSAGRSSVAPSLGKNEARSANRSAR